MPRVVKGELPGLVFNISYGIQGQARYTHVPGILEMVGVPYVGSGPLAHSLALDKVVAKMIFLQNGVPTPPFAVLNNPDFDPPDLMYPLIVKPKNEAVSMGIQIVNDIKQLREASDKIFTEFRQQVLAEQVKVLARFDLIHMHETVSPGSRHSGINLCNHQSGVFHSRTSDINGNTQAAVAELIRRTHLNQCHIQSDSLAGEQPGNL